MTDYGHEVEFGLFPTPDAARAHHLLELSAVAEVSGLDLVTVQDHPYQARHLDAWTLLSVIAARTTTLRVAPNVANLPLRNPVVLARSVASLDVLSGGRVDLGIGAGAFWDGIEAAGGRRLTPGRSVDALEEAIAILRAMWAGVGSVRLDGVHHRVSGLRSGPAPAHPVGIWVGAYKPRMLRLTGRLADGWLPSQGYAAPDTLGPMNERIDEAALAAGRAPEAVRRLYNVSGAFGAGGGFLRGRPSEWAEQLAGLTLEQGVATYILATDDPDDVRRFGEEVAPAVRDLVATERERRADAVHRPSSFADPQRVETVSVSGGAVRASTRVGLDPPGGSPDTGRRCPAHRHHAMGRVQPADLPAPAGPGRADGIRAGAARRAAAPRRRARPPAGRAGPGARRRRPGRAGSPAGGVRLGRRSTP